MKKANDILRALQTLREHIDPDISVQRALVFLLVAANDGISQNEIMQRGKLQKGATSRNILDLTSMTSRKQKGPGLFETRPDPMERRSNLIFLTPKGKKLAKEVLK